MLYYAFFKLTSRKKLNETFYYGIYGLNPYRYKFIQLHKYLEKTFEFIRVLFFFLFKIRQNFYFTNNN